MSSMRMLIIFTAFWISFSGILTETFAASQWNLILNDDGQPTAAYVEFVNPIRLKLELSVDLNPQGVPTRGTVRFENGFSRRLGSEEMMFYWNDHSGSRQLWETKALQEQTDIITPSELTQAFQDAYVRIFLTNRKEFIGHILSISEEMIQLDVDANWPLEINLSQIRQIQFDRNNGPEM